jgi:hypothetical protein
METSPMLVAALLASLSVAAPVGWHVLASAPDRAQLGCANRNSDRPWWRVALVDGAVRIKEDNGPDADAGVPFPTDVGKGRRTALRIPGGWLVGFDAGEFGGNLWWFGEDGSHHRELRANGHAVSVRALVKLRAGILVAVSDGNDAIVEGAPHPPHGRILLLQPETLQMAPLALVPHSVNAMIREMDDTVLASTLEQIVRVHGDGTVDHLGHVGPKDELTLSTLVLDEQGILWMAAEHHVVRARPGRAALLDIEWLSPDDCASFDTRCRCVPYAAGLRER